MSWICADCPECLLSLPTRRHACVLITADACRLNVALTRARRNLIVVGHAPALQQSAPAFAALLARCRGTPGGYSPGGRLPTGSVGGHGALSGRQPAGAQRGIAAGQAPPPQQSVHPPAPKPPAPPRQQQAAQWQVRAGHQKQHEQQAQQAGAAAAWSTGAAGDRSPPSSLRAGQQQQQPSAPCQPAVVAPAAPAAVAAAPASSGPSFLAEHLEMDDDLDASPLPALPKPQAAPPAAVAATAAATPISIPGSGFKQQPSTSSAEQPAWHGGSAERHQQVQRPDSTTPASAAAAQRVAAPAVAAGVPPGSAAAPAAAVRPLGKSSDSEDGWDDDCIVGAQLLKRR